MYRYPEGITKVQEREREKWNKKLFYFFSKRVRRCRVSLYLSQWVIHSSFSASTVPFNLRRHFLFFLSAYTTCNMTFKTFIIHLSLIWVHVVSSLCYTTSFYSSLCWGRWTQMQRDTCRCRCCQTTQFV